jgi:ABC-type hemin transport system substrate-binding protein
MRVVSLVPSATETLLAFGVEPVACTRFCEQPSIASVGGTKDPDVDAIVALQPDVVVVDKEENRLEDAEALAAAGVRLFTFAVRSVRDSVEQCAALAAELGVVATDWEPPAMLAADTTAFVPIWRRPWMALGRGTYGADLLAHLGVDVAYDERYATIEDLAAVTADVVLAPSEPYPFRMRHAAELSTVAPVVLVDGQDLFWWGARTPAAIERLRVKLDGRPA